MGKENNVYIKKARHKRRIRKTIFFAIIFIGIFSFVVFKTSLFTIKNINIEGNILVTKDYVKEISDKYKGDNIVLLKSSDIKSTLKKNPYIDSIKIKRQFPNTITLEISECEGLYYVYDGSDNNILSSDCTLLEKTDDIKDRKLIQVVGLDVQSMQVGSIVSEDPRIKDILSEIYKEEQIIEDNGENFNITGISVQDMSSIKVYLGDIYVLVGSDENFRKKMSDAITIYKTGNVKEYINVSFNGTPDFK